MIKVYKEIRLQDFEAWGGAQYTMGMIENFNAWACVEDYIAEVFPDGIEETKLNDLLWFDGENILRDYGYPVEE